VGEFSNVFFVREFADALYKAGRFDEALVAVERAASSEDRWQTPELLRLKGEIILGQSGVGARQTAQDFFRQALDLSGQQGALSWELRAASSLARLFQEQGLSADAAEALQPVYARFTEGFATPDLRAARALLDTLHLPEAGP
jgi:predicted ATPase